MNKKKKRRRKPSETKNDPLKIIKDMVKEKKNLYYSGSTYIRMIIKREREIKRQREINKLK